MVELGEVCEINPLKNEIKNLKDELEVTFLPMEDLWQWKMYFETKKVKTKWEVYSWYTFFRDNDILLAKVTPCFENWKSWIAKNLINWIWFGSTEYYILRWNENILPDWIYLNISSCYFLNNWKNNMNWTGGLKRLTKDFVKNFKIPLPPLEIQEQIVWEIEKYQKIIDGAKLIVKNYKPGIKIDESWEVVELGEVTKIITGKLNANAMVENWKYPFFTCSKEIYKIDTYSFDDEVLLLSWNNASWNYDVKYYNWKFNAYQRTYIITIKNKNILYFYLKLFLESKLLELKDKSVWWLTKFLTLWVIQQLKIPLPPLEIQEQIVAKIEEEQKMVESAKWLIEIFEKKIKDRIGEVWWENISL